MNAQIDRVLIIVPCRNESDKFRNLIESLENLNLTKPLVILAVNNSNDDSLKLALELESSIEILAEEVSVKGSLFSAAEYATFLLMADKYFMKNLAFTHVMKLDADVILESKYFEYLLSEATGLGVCGGPLPNEQATQISGAVKLYSRSAYEVIRQIPPELGFDIADEFYVLRAGLPVEIINKCKFTLVRVTGSSEGVLKGRYRNGKVCRRVGYNKLYFTFKVVRFLFRKPIFLGSIFMSIGYIFENKRPFDDFVGEQLRVKQINNLSLLLKSPRMYLRKLRGSDVWTQTKEKM